MYENRENRRPNSRFGDIPVKEGDTYDVEIEGIGEKGDGIAKIKGYVIIVPNVKKGDRVKVKVNAVRGKVSFGEVIGEGSASAEPDEDTVETQNDGEDPDEMNDDASDVEESEETEDAGEEEKEEKEEE